MIKMYGHTELSKLPEERGDERSFQIFAESMCSDVRGQIFNLTSGDSLSLWTEQWPRHLFIILVIHGELTAAMEGGTVHLRQLSQLVVLPNLPCELQALSNTTIEIISLLSQEPVAEAKDTV